MIHHHTDMAGVAAVRARHPRAAIIRNTGPGRYVVFEYATDAIGHRTAVTIESGTLYHDGRIETTGEKVA